MVSMEGELLLKISDVHHAFNLFLSELFMISDQRVSLQYNLRQTLYPCSIFIPSLSPISPCQSINYGRAQHPIINLPPSMPQWKSRNRTALKHHPDSWRLNDLGEMSSSLWASLSTPIKWSWSSAPPLPPKILSVFSPQFSSLQPIVFKSSAHSFQVSPDTESQEARRHFYHVGEKSSVKTCSYGQEPPGENIKDNWILWGMGGGGRNILSTKGNSKLWALTTTKEKGWQGAQWCRVHLKSPLSTSTECFCIQYNWKGRIRELCVFFLKRCTCVSSC